MCWKLALKTSQVKKKGAGSDSPGGSKTPALWLRDVVNGALPQQQALPVKCYCWRRILKLGAPRGEALAHTEVGEGRS